MLTVVICRTSSADIALFCLRSINVDYVRRLRWAYLFLLVVQFARATPISVKSYRAIKKFELQKHSSCHFLISRLLFFFFYWVIPSIDRTSVRLQFTLLVLLTVAICVRWTFGRCVVCTHADKPAFHASQWALSTLLLMIAAHTHTPEASKDTLFLLLFLSLSSSLSLLSCRRRRWVPHASCRHIITCVVYYIKCINSFDQQWREQRTTKKNKTELFYADLTCNWQ